jgi:hypothetical protein
MKQDLPLVLPELKQDLEKAPQIEVKRGENELHSSRSFDIQMKLGCTQICKYTQLPGE